MFRLQNYEIGGLSGGQLVNQTVAALGTEITLRDLHAGQAMAALVSWDARARTGGLEVNVPDGMSPPDAYAKQAYEFADALEKARKA